MYKMYFVPNASLLLSHTDLYNARQLLWDPYTESDAYAILDGTWSGELNKADSLEFTILPANAHYEDMQRKNTVVLLYDEDELLFEGYIADAPSDFYKQRKVTCSGVLAYLCDSIQAPDEVNVIEIPRSSQNNYIPVAETWLSDANPKALNWYERSIVNGNIVYFLTNDTSPIAQKKYFYGSSGDGQNYSGQTITRLASTNETIAAHIERLLGVHNSQVDAFKHIHMGVVIEDSTVYEFKASDFRTTWDALKSDILDDFGGYFRLRTGDDNKLYLDYMDITDMGTGDPSILEFSENIIEMTESDASDDDLFTVLVPIGKDKLTVSGVSGHDSPEYDENYLVNPYIASWNGNRRYVVVSTPALMKYGHIVKTQSFNDVTDANELYHRAIEYIYNNFIDLREYEVKGIDLKNLGLSSTRITIGDNCTIKSDWHNIDESYLYVMSAERDLLNPENDSFKIGMPTSDKDAKNKTLTSQTEKEASDAKSGASGMSSGMGAMGSILDNYIHVTEWGLELSSRWKNDLESESMMNRTRFIQDEYSINLAAQKIFGEEQENNQDAGYFLVPKSEHWKDQNAGLLKNPETEHWYEKINGKYVLSTDKEAALNKDFYTMRLWTRYSEVDVGPGGIKARVDGNYDRSTACSSWINMNEDNLLALTGHLYVDENGQVIVKSGAGFRTGHTEERTDATYIQVPNSWRSQNPKEKGWYERTLDSSGAWIGNGKTDSATNSVYYTRTTDTSAVPGKYYYYLNTVREEFTADYGIYDENTLTAGIMVQSINNPQYIVVSGSEKKMAQADNLSPHALGWFEYNETTGTYGLTIDTSVRSTSKYYKTTNNMQNWTYLKGDRIVIGYDENAYSGLPSSQKARINKYFEDNGILDYTLTEIATDSAYCRAFFVDHLEFREGVGEGLTIDFLGASELSATGSIRVVTSESDGGGRTIIDGNGIETSDIYADSVSGYRSDFGTITLGSESEGSITFGSPSFEDPDPSSGIDPADIVVAFGTITTTGDTVKIPYITAGMDGTPDNDHVLSFDKPASFGRVAWEDGEVIKAYTAGDKLFFSADLQIDKHYDGVSVTYKRTGSSFSDLNYSMMNNKPTLRAVLQVAGTWTGLSLDESEDEPHISAWEKPIFFDASLPFNDGVDDAKSKFGISGVLTATADNTSEGQSMNAASTLSYGATYMYYSTYNGSRHSSKQYFKTPADRYGTGYSTATGTVRTYASIDGAAYTDSVADRALSYNKTYTIQAQYKANGASNYTSLMGIKVKTPVDRYSTGYSNAINTVRTHMQIGSTEYTDSGTVISLSSNTEYTIQAQYKTEGSSSYTSSTGIKVKTPSSASFTNSDIQIGNYARHSVQPSGTEASSMKSKILECIQYGSWFRFRVYINGTNYEKYYTMNFAS